MTGQEKMTADNRSCSWLAQSRFSKGNLRRSAFVCGLIFLLLCSACRSTKSAEATTAAASEAAGAGFVRNRAGSVMDNFLKSEITPADGFDFPFGDVDGKGSYADTATGKTHNGWYIATKYCEQYSLGIHPAEDWNGSGGGNTDYVQPVYAAGNGRVIAAENFGQPWGNIVIIEHVFYENHEQKFIRSLYAHLSEIRVRAGDEVKRRQPIGAIGQDPNKTFAAHLHLEFRQDDTLAPTFWPSSNGKDVAWVRQHYAEPSAFIRAHRKLFVPQNEGTLILVDQASYKMRLYKNGNQQGEFDVSFGQAKGQKQVQGDNKTPRGMYFVLHKHRGKFDGEYGAYYGGHWIKLNYPNKYDAARGRAQGLISETQQTAIATNWAKRAATMENTRLGGGIGFHGWINEWSNDGPRHLSWGCVVMHIYDISKVFDQIPPGAMVVIF